MMLKETLIPITDSAEIASIQAEEFGSIIGGQIGDMWWAYKWSVLDWRARQGSPSTDRSEQT